MTCGSELSGNNNGKHAANKHALAAMQEELREIAVNRDFPICAS